MTNMKKSHQRTMVLAGVLCGLWACGPNATDTPKNLPVVATSEPATVITEEFAAFLNGFRPLGGEVAYDSAWAHAWKSGGGIQEISAKHCERYLNNRTVRLPQGNSLALPSASYYRVGRLPDQGSYIGVVLADWSDEGGLSVYLCSYRRDGTFLDGLLLFRESVAPMAGTLLLSSHPAIHILLASGAENQYGIDTSGHILLQNPG
jgi:hypothetical protein